MGVSRTGVSRMSVMNNIGLSSLTEESKHSMVASRMRGRGHSIGSPWGTGSYKDLFRIRAQCPALLLTRCLVMGKLLNLTMPPFPLLQNGDNNSNYQVLERQDDTDI